MQPLNPNPIPNFPPNSHLISIKLQESAKIKIKNAKKKKIDCGPQHLFLCFIHVYLKIVIAVKIFFLKKRSY
jgi:hypothetical protein